MEALDDLLSDTDCEAVAANAAHHLSAFNFTAFSKRLREQEGAEIDNGLGVADLNLFHEVKDWSETASVPSDLPSGVVGEPPHTRYGKSLWDIPAMSFHNILMPEVDTWSNEGRLTDEVETGTGADASLRSTPRSPHSAEARGGAFSEGELRARSALVAGSTTAVTSGSLGTWESGQDKAIEKSPSSADASHGRNVTISASVVDVVPDPGSSAHEKKCDSAQRSAETLAAPGWRPAAANTRTDEATGALGMPRHETNPRSFLRKGSRMPRSTAGRGATRPIANHVAHRPLRLQARSASVPAVGPSSGASRGVGRSHLHPAEPTAGVERTDMGLGDVVHIMDAGWCVSPDLGSPFQEEPHLERDMCGDVAGVEGAVAQETPHGADAPALAGEAPTSPVVRSYFATSALFGTCRPRAQQMCSPQQRDRQSHWEGTAAYQTLYGQPTSSATVDLKQDAQEQGDDRPQPRSSVQAALEEEVRLRLVDLDQQMKRYQKECDALKKLQAQAEQAERDLIRDREKLWREVEMEKRSLHTEFDVERNSMKKERRRLSQAAEKQRQHVQEEREVLEERRRLQDRVDQLEEELREKEKRWQRNTDRLQRQICDMNRKNQELQEEVKQANLQSQGSHSSSAWCEPRRCTSATVGRVRRAPASTLPCRRNSKPPRGGCSSSLRHPDADILEEIERDGLDDQIGANRADEDETEFGLLRPEEVQEVRSGDGRVERIFADGHREIAFPNGLKKVIWLDGRTSVKFQNGDQKELQADGVVVYHYAATGAVQTTLPDGTELYQFADGQFERHCPDGYKEIQFLNGTTKRIFSDGSEEVCFADGTRRSSTSSSQSATGGSC